jgi:hypothetical protein
MLLIPFHLCFICSSFPFGSDHQAGLSDKQGRAAAGRVGPTLLLSERSTIIHSLKLVPECSPILSDRAAMASLAASKSSVVARAVAGRTVRVAPRIAVSSSRRTAVEVRASTGAPLVGSKAPDFKAQVMMMEGR